MRDQKKKFWEICIAFTLIFWTHIHKFDWGLFRFRQRISISLISTIDAIHKVNDSANIPVTRKPLKKAKDAHPRSVIHDQLIAEKEKEKASQKQKEEDQKRVNDEKKKIDLRI